MGSAIKTVIELKCGAIATNNSQTVAQCWSIDIVNLSSIEVNCSLICKCIDNTAKSCWFCIHPEHINITVLVQIRIKVNFGIIDHI